MDPEVSPTAAMLVEWAKDLEMELEALYSTLARQFPEHQGTLTQFAVDSTKNHLAVTRTYRETISDALEACFCFDNLPPLPTHEDLNALRDSVSPLGLHRAIAVEEAATAFYQGAADQARSLLATMANAFARAAKSHAKHLAILRSLGCPDNQR